MKRLFVLLAILFFFPFSEMTSAQSGYNGINLVKEGKDYIVNFTLPDYQTEFINAEGEDYINFVIPDYGTTSDPGLPQLPIFSFNLNVSIKETNPSVQVLNINKEEITLSNKVYPFQMPWEKVNLPADRPFTINRDYYNSPGIALPFSQTGEMFVIAGANGTIIRINPFSYSPVENKLTVIKSGSFRIRLNFDQERDIDRSADMQSFLNGVFVNYIPAGIQRGIRYLIITAPEFEAGLAPFVNLKQSNGYTVDLFTTAVTGTTTTTIKSFIQTRYNDLVIRPEFILLVGDVNKIPNWVGSGEGNPPTDLKYVLLDGTDNFADASIGRFSVISAAELQNAINKIAYMETYIGTLAKKNAYMASTDNYTISEGTHNYVISTYFGPANYTNLKLYTHTYNATTEQLITALNDNQIFAIYSGHGATTYWADGPVLNQTQVRALTNTVFPFVYSFACITGDYTYSECFGETWLRTTTGGSAFYGSSVNSYWDEDDILEKNVFKAMFVDDITKITPMFNKGKIYLVNHYGSVTPTVLRYLEMYNLMGDPSLPVVRQIPPDTTAPGPITNLTIPTVTSNALTLNWTAPYDSTFGGVVAYDIRYSTTAITNETQFNNAPQRIFGGQSDTAGTPKTYILDSLNFSTTYYCAIKAMDMWGNKSPMSNVPGGLTYGAPHISVNPDSMHCLMLPNAVEVDTILLSNTTSYNSTLDYTIELANNVYPNLVSAKIIQLSRNNVQENIKGQLQDNGGSVKGSGGPDLFGYRWIDSDDPQGPDYIWNDIAATGTQVTNWIPNTTSSTALDDGHAGPFNIGFPFKYYGENKNQLYVCTNGFITFSPVSVSGYSNEILPNSSLPNGLICALWDDLDGRTSGTVHYKNETNKFTIQFTNWQIYSASGSLTFQVVFHSNGKIIIYYKTLTGTLTSCTVGIENLTGTDGLTVANNAAYLKNNFALQFAAEPDWLAINNWGGTLYNGNSAAVVLTMNSDGLEIGNYSMDMVFHSNDPANSELTVPISLEVSYVPVELVSFTAENVFDEVILRWNTATETNNRGFRISKAIVTNDQKSWEEKVFLEGAGTKTTPSEYSFRDKITTAGKVFYRLEQLDLDGTISLTQEIEVDLNGPADFALLQNYPNPFNPSTTIKFALPERTDVKLFLFNSLGEKVNEMINRGMEAGYHQYEFNGSNLSSGIYYYTLSAGEFYSIKKMILIK